MNQPIGYSRVSTDDQYLDFQHEALAQAGCSVICEVSVSAKNAAQLKLEQNRKALRIDDTLVVWSLDRLGLRLHNLVQIVAKLERSRISFKSLTEKIETSSAAGKLIFHVFAALAGVQPDPRTRSCRACCSLCQRPLRWAQARAGGEAGKGDQGVAK